MEEKYNPKYESQIMEMAKNRLGAKTYKVFDYQARIFTREYLPELKEQGRTDNEQCLIIVNKDGDTIAITQEFEKILFNVLKNRG